MSRVKPSKCCGPFAGATGREPYQHRLPNARWHGELPTVLLVPQSLHHRSRSDAVAGATTIPPGDIDQSPAQLGRTSSRKKCDPPRADRVRHVALQRTDHDAV